MSRYLLDTNHLSVAIHPVSNLRDRLRQARTRGHVLGICVPVLCELEIGIAQTSDPDANHRRLRFLLGSVRIWPFDAAVAPAYAAIYADLRRRGRVLSQIDLLIATLCRQMNLTLLTSDRDFEALPDLRTENWLIDPPVATS